MSSLTLSKGFTLLESALVIIVAAAIISMGIKSYSSIQTQKKVTQAQQQLTTLYQAALKAPNIAVSDCGVGKQCLGLPSDTFTNPWGQSNSIAVVGTQFVLRSTLPTNAVCKALLQRFSSIQSSADKATSTGANTCKVGSDSNSEKNLEIYISIYQ